MKPFTRTKEEESLALAVEQKLKMNLQSSASAAMNAAAKLQKLHTKKDYVPWAMTAESILITNNLWIRPDLIKKAPEADKEKSQAAYYVLVVMLSPQVQLLVRSLKTCDSVVVWNYLEEKFVGSGVVPVINLVDEVFSLKHVHGSQPVSL